jgi:hypothetical protein
VDSLGFVLVFLERYEEALPYLLEAEEAFTHVGRLEDLITTQERIGLVYKERGDLDKVGQWLALRDQAAAAAAAGPSLAPPYYTLLKRRWLAMGSGLPPSHI